MVFRQAEFFPRRSFIQAERAREKENERQEKTTQAVFVKRKIKYPGHMDKTLAFCEKLGYNILVNRKIQTRKPKI